MRELILLLSREQGGKSLAQILYDEYLNILHDIKRSTPLDEEVKKVYDSFIEKYVREIVTSRVLKIIKNENIPKNTVDMEILKSLNKIVKVYIDILQGKVLVDGNYRVPVKVLKNCILDKDIALNTKVPRKLKKGETILMPLKIAIPLYILELIEVKF